MLYYQLIVKAPTFEIQLLRGKKKKSVARRTCWQVLRQNGIRLVWGKGKSGCYHGRLMGWQRALKARLTLLLSQKNFGGSRVAVTSHLLWQQELQSLLSELLFYLPFPNFPLVSACFLCLSPHLFSLHRSSFGPSHLGLQNSRLSTEQKSFMKFAVPGGGTNFSMGLSKEALTEFRRHRAGWKPAASCL